MKLNLRIFCMCGIILIITALSTSCKKDYPDDIPKWLKEEIRKYKKEADPGECYYSTGCRTIKEYSNQQNEKIYQFSGVTDNPIRYNYYDYYGNFICRKESTQLPAYDICGDIYLNDYVFTRVIWIEPDQRL